MYYLSNISVEKCLKKSTVYAQQKKRNDALKKNSSYLFPVSQSDLGFYSSWKKRPEMTNQKEAKS